MILLAIGFAILCILTAVGAYLLLSADRVLNPASEPEPESHVAEQSLNNDGDAGGRPHDRR